MFIDRDQIAEMEMFIPGLNNARYLTMRCFVWLVRIVYGAMIFAIVAGLITAQLSSTTKHVEMPKSKV